MLAPAEVHVPLPKKEENKITVVEESLEIIVMAHLCGCLLLHGFELINAQLCKIFSNPGRENGQARHAQLEFCIKMSSINLS